MGLLELDAEDIVQAIQAWQPTHGVRKYVAEILA